MRPNNTQKEVTIMSNDNVNPAPVVETIEDAPSNKKFCFTRKQIIIAAAATATAVAGTAVVVYLKAKGTDVQEVVTAASDAVKETVESA